MSALRTLRAAALIALLAATKASALDEGGTNYLLKTAPRAAGMGGAFTAVPNDPIGMFWNPAAALRMDRLAISGTHSLRHFPGAKKNLDQMDSDMVGVVVPLTGDQVAGAAFNMPGEWGVDHMDTNDVLKNKQRVRGRERRIAFSDLLNGANETTAGYVDSNWYRDDAAPGGPARKFQSGGGFSFFYEDDNGMMYGINARGLLNLIKGREKEPSKKSASAKITLGVAYRPDRLADTLAAADLELAIGEKTEARWFAGVERSFDREKYFLRAGSMNGMLSYGAGARAGSLRMDYAVVKNFLPKITGEKNVLDFQDAHFASYTLKF